MTSLGKNLLGRRGRLTATAVGLVAGTALLAAAPAQASWFSARTFDYVTSRDCYHPTKQPYPSQSCTAQVVLPPGTPVHIVCQYSGQQINGDPVWDYVTYAGGEGYVTDAYVRTGYSNWIPGVDRCRY